MSEQKCPCDNCCYAGKTQEFHKPAEGQISLADLPVGASAKILKIIPRSRGRKKFADIGLVPGTELLMEAHAPFGGLIRVKVMETSMALHRDDAADIVLETEE